MLHIRELIVLNAWCRRRALRWYPAQEAGQVGLVLEGTSGRLPWDRMILVLDDDGFRLRDEQSDTLATASDLPALFDAVDGGVAEPSRGFGRTRTVQATHGLVI
jgi:hypothetical protein